MRFLLGAAVAPCLSLFSGSVWQVKDRARNKLAPLAAGAQGLAFYRAGLSPLGDRALSTAHGTIRGAQGSRVLLESGLKRTKY